MIVTTSSLYKLAYSKYAIGAYNINNLEQILGLFKGCIDSKAPFIIQLSKGARSYADKRMPEAMIRTAEEIYPDAVFAVHLDHGDEETCYDCIESGFYSSVMIDASHEPFEENVTVTCTDRIWRRKSEGCSRTRVGANNLVRVEHAKPKNARILGAGSSVVQAGKDR
jgi:fructose/tagatose bisphosphate aldolase